MAGVRHKIWRGWKKLKIELESEFKGFSEGLLDSSSLILI